MCSSPSCRSSRAASLTTSCSPPVLSNCPPTRSIRKPPSGRDAATLRTCCSARRARAATSTPPFRHTTTAAALSTTSPSTAANIRSNCPKSSRRSSPAAIPSSMITRWQPARRQAQRWLALRLRQYVLRKARQSAFGAVIEKRQDSPRAALCGGRRGLLSFLFVYSFAADFFGNILCRMMR